METAYVTSPGSAEGESQFLKKLIVTIFCVIFNYDYTNYIDHKLGRNREVEDGKLNDGKKT